MADEYTEIARRFFNEFLELKLQLDTGQLDRRDWSKEIDGYRRLNMELKKAASDLAEQNMLLSNDLGRLEDEKAELRRQLNQAIINLGRLQEKLGKVTPEREGYSFVEHMSDESRRAWESLMQELPSRRG